jgi:hypothetical protein
MLYEYKAVVRNALGDAHDNVIRYEIHNIDGEVYKNINYRSGEDITREHYRENRRAIEYERLCNNRNKLEQNHLTGRLAEYVYPRNRKREADNLGNDEQSVTCNKACYENASSSYRESVNGVTHSRLIHKREHKNREQSREHKVEDIRRHAQTGERIELQRIVRKIEITVNYRGKDY